MSTTVAIGQERVDIFGMHAVFIIGQHPDGAWLVLAPQESVNLIPDRASTATVLERWPVLRGSEVRRWESPR